MYNIQGRILRNFYLLGGFINGVSATLFTDTKLKKIKVTFQRSHKKSTSSTMTLFNKYTTWRALLKVFMGANVEQSNGRCKIIN